MNQDVLCVIIGRKGSKGAPGKNSAAIAGKPCVTWSIEHARSCHTVTRLLVSTDCPRVTAAAEQMGAEVVKRPPDLADDNATVDAAVRHAVRTTRDDAPVVVILYANVPVRPAGLVDRAVNMLRETGADSVQSYASVGKYHPLWMMRLDDDARVQPYSENRIYRRQDLPPLYIPDGGVIAVRRESLMQEVPGEPHAFLGKDRRGIINEAGAVIDIDQPTDLALAEAVLSRCADPGEDETISAARMSS